MADRALTLPYWLREADELLKRTTVNECRREEVLLSAFNGTKEDLMKVCSMEMSRCTEGWSPEQRKICQDVWRRNIAKHEGEQNLFRTEYLGHSPDECKNDMVERAIALELSDYRWRIRHLIHQFRDEVVLELPGMRELSAKEFCPSDNFVLANKIMSGMWNGTPMMSRMKQSAKH